MFSPPRLIAIDDEQAHLNALIDTLQSIGTSCFGLRYDPSATLNPECFAGVRCLFMDLHLTPGLSRESMHFTVIAEILEANISKAGGPFILIVWTSQDQNCDGLRTFLETRLTGEQAYACPLAVLPLPKSSFINLTDGAVADPQRLQAEIKRLVESIPQLAALLGWESKVLGAAGATLAALLQLVPLENRTGAAFPEAVDLILSRLACEAVGKSNVAADPRGAVFQALGPILSDRVMNEQQDPNETFWAAAVTKHGVKNPPPATVEEAGLINRMLHLAVPPAEVSQASDWGTVSHWPFGWPEASEVPYLGLKVRTILGGEFQLEGQDRQKCRPVLVRVGAVCDAAQKKSGPTSFFFGMEVPHSALRKTRDGTVCPLTDAIWESPLFKVEKDEPFNLYVHTRFPLALLPDQIDGWKVRYRMRESLLMHLLTMASSYSSRPGIVRLNAR